MTLTRALRVLSCFAAVAVPACSSDSSERTGSSSESTSAPFCGDGFCSLTENAIGCPSDCWGLRGCFQDAPTRTLPTYLGDGYTIESCRAAAAGAGHQFAGVQWYGQCFAGDALPPTLIDDSACNTACNANTTEGCGGAWANRVFASQRWDHVHIDAPNVNQRVTDYPTIRFAPGDQVWVSANGCVQTGGAGDTWKRYVNPTGGNADRLYHGRVWIPGATMGMETIGSAQAHGAVIVPTPPASANPAEMYLRLGYDDDDYSDNGYWGHDPGTENQCAGWDGGNAYVDLWTYHGGDAGVMRPCAGVDGYPMDPHWTALDPNYLPLNPMWGEQCWSSDPQNMSIPFLCGGDGTYYDAYNRPDPSCTRYTLTVDTKDAPWTPFGWLCHGDYGVNGHLNWGFAAFTGNLYWQEYDNATTGDGDFNLLLTTPNDASLALANGTVRDHTAWGIPNGPDYGRRGLQLEFAGAETVYRYMSMVTFQNPYLTPFWHTVAYGSDPDRAALLDGRPAVATGLVNLDMVHNPAVELHPLLALAVQTKSPARGDAEEAWLIMVRRAGDQGECSHSDVAGIHGFDGHDVRFNLDSSYARPTIDWTQTLLYDGTTPASFAVTPRPGGGILVAVPNPPVGDVALGELHLRACAPQCAGRCGGDDGCGATCPATTCPGSQVCTNGYCQCPPGTTWCGGQCATACAYCGDGSCNAGETCGTCPDDCGACGCAAGKVDCCGDGTMCMTPYQCSKVQCP
jgi:hypothetical protein